MLTRRRGLAALFALLALALGFSGVAAAAPESPDDTTVTSSCTPPAHWAGRDQCGVHPHY